MENFHRIKEVKVLDEHTLFVEFLDGRKVLYNINELIKKYDMFKPLMKKDLLYECKVDIKGYGVYWNDDLDISCNELWENGKSIA